MRCPCLVVLDSLVPGLPHPLGWLAVEGAEPVMINGCWASLWLIVLYCLIETVSHRNCACFSIFSQSDPNIMQVIHRLSIEVSEPDVQMLVTFGGNEAYVVMAS